MPEIIGSARSATTSLRNFPGKIPSGLALFLKNNEGVFIALNGTYVDNTLHTGSDQFFQISRKTTAEFDSKETPFGNFAFAGVQFSSNDVEVTLCRTFYCSKLSLPPFDACYKDFKSKIMELGWIIQIRPDIAFAAVIWIR